MDKIKNDIDRNRPHAQSYKWKGAFILMLLLTFAGCSPISHITSGAGRHIHTTGATGNSPLLTIAQPNASHTDLTARMAIDAAYNDHVLTLKGNLRMRRGEVIQMAFTALGMVEIARVELTPQAAYLIDRLSKQYAMVSYDKLKLPGIDELALDYGAIEALLWNELFIPGQKKILSHLNLFDTTPSETQILITPKAQQAMDCRFWTDANYSRLQRTQLAYHGIKSVWDYSSFQDINGSRFPTALKVSLENAKEGASATIAYSNLIFDNTEWTTRTNLSNYTMLSIEEFIRRLSFLK